MSRTLNVVRMLACVSAAAALCATLPGAASASTSTEPVLKVSKRTDRSSSILLSGGTLQGKVAIFVQAERPVKSVQFRIDDPAATRSPFSTEGVAAYDLAGTASTGAAVLYDTTRLADGRHDFSALVTHTDGSRSTLTSAVQVRNTVAPAYPTAATTGVPAGTVLKPSASLMVTRDGTVLDALHVTGNITIDGARDVVIRRSLVTASGMYGIRTRNGGSVLVEDVEINAGGVSVAAVCCSNYTLNRVNIHGGKEGPRLGSNTVVTNSYIHSMRTCTGCHVDVLQSTGGTNILVKGNSLQAYNPVSGIRGNAVFQFGEEHSAVRNCRVEGNLMNGGNYTVNGFGGKTTGAQCTLTANRFGRNARYGVKHVPSGVVWSSTNVWHDTGAPAS